MSDPRPDDAFGNTGRPVVLVQHTSAKPGSLFHPDDPGHALKDYRRATTPDLLVTKTVHSSFHGTPDLHGWLAASGVSRLVVSGITTNFATVVTTEQVLHHLHATVAGPDPHEICLTLT